MSDRQLKVSFGPHIKESFVTPFIGDWDSLTRKLASHGQTQEGKDGVYIVGSHFRGGRARRRQPLVEGIDLIGLDFDENVPENWGEILGSSFPFERFIYTSHSHGRPEKGGGHRGRALLPLSRTVTPEEFSALMLWAFDRCSSVGLEADKGCKDTTRAFYTPRRKAPDAVLEPIVGRVEGEWLNPDALPDGVSVAELIKARQESGFDLRRSADLSNEERAQRLSEWRKLESKSLSRAARYAHAVCRGVLERCETTNSGRRVQLFKAGCSIGSWEATGAISPSEAANYADEAFGIISRRMGDKCDAQDLRRQLQNGLDRGRTNPADIPRDKPTLSDADIEAIFEATGVPEEQRKLVVLGGRSKLPIIPDNEEALSIEDARNKTTELVSLAMRTPGRVTIGADPGAGKSTAALHGIVDAWLEGKTVRYVVPTNKLANEKLQELTKIASERLSPMELPGLLAVLGMGPKRNERNCQNLDAVVAGRKAFGCAGAKAVCKRCDLHPRNNFNVAYCDFMKQVRHADEKLRIEVNTHSIEVQNEKKHVDVLIVDEYPKAVNPTMNVSFDDLLEWREAGDIEVSDEVLNDILAMMKDAKAPFMRFGQSDLAKACPPGALKVTKTDGFVRNKTGEELILDLAEKAGGGDLKAIEALSNAPNAAALKILEDLVNRNWTGCYVDRKGLIQIVQPKPLRLDADSVLYLDGTATESVGRSLLGPDAVFHRVPVRFHQDTTVQRVDWGASKNLVRSSDDSANEDASLRTLNRLQGLVHAYESPTTAWVIHQSWTRSLAVQELLSEAFKHKRVTYYGSPDAVGSNRFEGCKRIVLADRHLPMQAIGGLAGALYWRARDDEYIRSEDWSAHAEHLTVGADIVQAMHRVRPGIHKREIIICTERELPKAWDTWRLPDEDPDILAAEKAGLVPAGRKGAVWLIRKKVAQNGFVLPTVTKDPGSAIKSLIKGKPGCLMTVLKSAYGCDFPTIAADAELDLGYVETSARGQPIPCLFNPEKPPNVKDIANRLVSAGRKIRWAEWENERFEVVNDTAEVIDSLRTLPFEHLTEAGLAAHWECSEATVYRRLRRAGLSMADVRCAWAEIHAPPDIEADSDDDSEGAYIVAGSPEWLLIAPSEWTDRWRQCETARAPPGTLALTG